mmetsp:Transcript_68766/g.212644  ORF Transcript_68766/g.212644 Transcript_68766/m.212644 type:complete len:200 (+) Transcript_68766:702-1301(+)
MLPVLQANSSNVWSVSTSWASISVTSRRRSNMFMSTVPFLVTICFRLNVFSFSLGGSNAVFRSAKGSAICFLGSWPPGFRLPASPPVAFKAPALSERGRPPLAVPPRLRFRSSCAWPPLCPVPPKPLAPGASRLTVRLSRPIPGMSEAVGGASSRDEKARFAVTGRRVPPLEPPSPSLLSSRIFIRAFSIFRIVALSMV